MTEEEIAVYADALANNELHKIDATLKKHLAECDDCTAEVLQVSQIASDTQDLSIEQEQPQKKKKKVVSMRNVLAIAAGIALLVGLGIWMHPQFFAANDNILGTGGAKEKDTGQPTYMGSDNPGEAKGKSGGDAYIAPVKRQGPQALVPYMKYEQIIKKQKSQQNFQTDQPRLIQTKIRKSLALSWSSASSSSYTFQVTDNKGNLLYTQEIQQNHIMLQGFKSPGLYYWKLKDSDEKLHYIGKIRAE